jgi:hypothetical protein
MFAWRVVGIVALFLAVGPSGRAQTYPLAEDLKEGDCFRIQLDMKLSGEIRIPKDGQSVALKLAAAATHEFPERVLAVGEGKVAEKTVRVYETARSVITRDSQRSEAALRPERRLIVAQRYKDQPLVYCPTGALFRSELELTSEHFDTLFVTGVLPGKAVAVGDTWKVPSAIAQALCLYEGLTEQELTAKLDEVKDQVAVFSITGSAAGIDGGALVKSKIQAAGRFDLGAKRLVALEWKQTDERDQGPVSPVSAIETTYKLKRQRIDLPAALADEVLASVPAGFQPPERLTHLDYRDPKDRFSLLHPREWQLVAQTDEHTVLRLMDKGDFVAQVTLSPWEPAPKGKHLTPDEFKKAMSATPGWEPEKELQAGEVPAGDTTWAYRLSVLGKMDGVAVLQNFYLVAAPGGEQLVLTFTLTPKQIDKLGSRDLSLVGSVELPAVKK